MTKFKWVLAELENIGGRFNSKGPVNYLTLVIEKLIHNVTTFCTVIALFMFFFITSDVSTGYINPRQL